MLFKLSEAGLGPRTPLRAVHQPLGGFMGWEPALRLNLVGGEEQDKARNLEPTVPKRWQWLS